MLKVVVTSLNVDSVIAVIANVLYLIDKNHFNIDKAFTRTCRRYRCHSNGLTREELFNLVYECVSKYLFIKSLLERIGKKSSSYRTYAKTFLYLKLKELGFRIPSKLMKAVRHELKGVEDAINELESWQVLSYPQWLYQRLVEMLGEEDATKLLNAMNRRTIWLRINTLRIDVDKALNSLERENVKYEVDRTIPFLVKILRSPRPVRSLKVVKEGAAIIQDKASVLTVIAMDPKPGDLIYDFAAAPGIKTSLIMQLTENKAHVIALDRSPKRLASIRSLLRKYGVDIDRVQVVLADSRIVSFAKRADNALVDAPCSSSGAIPKDPSIKLMLKSPKIPQKMHQIQLMLLANALRYSERVLFATCSILPEEGEEVVEKVINECDADLEDPNIPASRGYRRYSIWDKVRRTYPHLDECEGFFIARLISRYG